MIREFAWLIDDGWKCVGLKDIGNGGFEMVAYTDKRAIRFLTEQDALDFKHQILDIKYIACAAIEHGWY